MIALIAAAAVAAATPPAPRPAPPAPPAGAGAHKDEALTPMAERVVRLAALNKRTGLTQEFTAHPGDTLRFATLTVRVRACETTPPWEARQTAAYLQVDDTPVEVRTAARRTRRVFSGWMFAESPSLNPLEHPLYDVWVRSCTMRFPETGPDTVVAGRVPQSPPRGSQSKAAKSADAANAAASKRL